MMSDDSPDEEQRKGKQQQQPNKKSKASSNELEPSRDSSATTTTAAAAEESSPRQSCWTGPTIQKESKHDTATFSLEFTNQLNKTDSNMDDMDERAEILQDTAATVRLAPPRRLAKPKTTESPRLGGPDEPLEELKAPLASHNDTKGQLNNTVFKNKNKNNNTDDEQAGILQETAAVVLAPPHRLDNKPRTESQRGGPDVPLEELKAPLFTRHEEKALVFSSIEPPTFPPADQQAGTRAANKNKTMELDQRAPPPHTLADQEDHAAKQMLELAPRSEAAPVCHDDVPAKALHLEGEEDPPSSQRSTPGAYRLGGQSREHDDDSEEDEEMALASNAGAPPLQPSQGAISQDALAVAELVNEPELAQAEPMGWWTRRRIFYASAVAVILVGVVVGTLTAVLSGSSSSSSTTSDPAPTSAPTAPLPDLWFQVGEDLEGEAAGDMFGRSVHLSRDGGTLAIGSWANSANGPYAGHARVYRRNGDHWKQTGQTLLGEFEWDQFSRSVALSYDGTMLAVGAWFNNDNGIHSGHVQMFRLVDGAWKQIGRDIEGNATGDAFGSSVALSTYGDIVAIGAQQSRDSGDLPGYVRVFRLGEEGDSWNQIGQDLLGEKGDIYGFSVSLSGNGETLAINAPDNDGNGENSGATCIYHFMEGQWNQTGQCLYGNSANDRLGLGGVTLSVDGLTVATSAANGNGDVGYVKVYKLDGSSWKQVGQRLDGKSTDDLFGFSISLSSEGTVLAVGAPQKVTLNKGLHGYAAVYQLEAGSWVPLGREIEGTAANDYFGYTISLSGDGCLVAIGAPLNDGNGTDSGHVRVYQFTGSTLATPQPSTSVMPTSPSTVPPTLPDLWSQVGQDLYGDAQGDGFGRYISLSGDGTRVVVAAWFANANGEDSGQVKVYSLVGEHWNQTGQAIPGEAANDQSGRSVALSSDGTTIAIGAWKNSQNGISSGHVRVYRLDGDLWTQLGENIDGKAAFDQFGISVSLSSDGSILAVGANQYKEDLETFPGYVQVFSLDGETWNQMGQELVGGSAGINFGFVVALSDEGKRIAISAPWRDSITGQVQVFDFSSDGIWIQQGQSIDGEFVGDYCGWALSLSADGSTLAAGGWGNNGNGLASGHVRMFRLKNGLWTKIGYDLEGKSANDYFGTSVSLSYDGSVLAVGADQYSDADFLPGYVIVYRLEGQDWQQVGRELVGDAGGDKFGEAVSLSADGRTLVVGAYENDGGFLDAGSVRVYQLVE